LSTKKKGKEGGKGATRHDLRKLFWTGILEKQKPLSDLHNNISPSQYHWIGACVDRLWYCYGIREHDGQVELYIDFDKSTGEGNKVFFDALYARKAEIEEAFGGPLEWQRLDDKRSCRVRKIVGVGGWGDGPYGDELPLDGWGAGGWGDGPFGDQDVLIKPSTAGCSHRPAWFWVPFNPVHPRRPRKRRDEEILFL
jgi:hypothetical protein